MQQPLLDDRDNIRIERTRRDTTCSWDGGTIASDTHALLITVTQQDGMEYAAWIRMGHIDALQDTLSTFQPNEVAIGHELSPSGNVVYDTLTGVRRINCAVCDNPLTRGSGAVFFREALSPVAVHESCCGTVTSALETVWKHTPSLLPSTL